MLVRLLLLLCLGSTLRVAAQALDVPDAETARPPTPARIAVVLADSRRDGWAPQTAALRSAAMRAYADGNLYAAGAWFRLYQWAAVFGVTEADYVPRWAEEVTSARVGHSNMPRTLPMRPVPLSAAVSPDFQNWAVGDAEFSDQFFSLLSPVDYLPRVLEILDTLRRADRGLFDTYTNLALALAVVYDVPPPPFWPHWQVSAGVLPRAFPDPARAFTWWVTQDRLGRTFHSLKRLGPDELKFVVDAAAPFAELEWAQQNVDVPLTDLAQAYTRIKYRQDRIERKLPKWPGRSYKLADILATGGICVDQAYFATEVGKARGVPTLLFHGAGNDGWHAWFGYLDGDGHWQLDAGRYADQRFVTGLALDPQTWREFSDHELQFLRERFRSLPSYRQSCLHQAFAADMLRSGDAAGAAAAARKAVSFEPRNEEAWETLIAATEKRGADARTVEAVMREAALTFRRYPDLEASYISRVAQSLRARGQTSEADEILEELARKNRERRIDISVQQARALIEQSIRTQTLSGQLQTYRNVVESMGRGAGIAFYDRVVVLFVNHLLQLNHQREASRALDQAAAVLTIEPGSQFETEFKKLREKVDGPGASLPPA